MAKITFVYPDFENLGTGYLMALCLEQDHEVDFVYYQAEDQYLERKIKKMPYDQIAQRITNTKPDFVAFSCVTDNYQFQLQCARAFKKISPATITVFGGIHVTSIPDRVISNAEVDCICIGEGDISFPLFLKECTSKDGRFIFPDKPIKGIVFKKKDNLIGAYEEGELIDLDKLPLPYKDPFCLRLKDAAHSYKIMTSRGCPYECSYCLNSHYFKLRGKNILRRRSVDHVIKELLWAKSRYRIKYFFFEDDCFGTSLEWLSDFCHRYKKEVNFPFRCLFHPFNLSKEKIELLKFAGCIYVELGVQSLSQEINKDILYRKSNNDKIAEAINNLRDAGIMVQADHILGLPDDSIKIEEESILFYSKNRPSTISVFWLTYFPKLKIVYIAKEKGILSDKDIDTIEEGKRLSEGGFHSSAIRLKELEDYHSIALVLNYLPLLPSFLINFIIKSGIYRIFKIHSFFISAALPRFILAISKKKDCTGRSHITRFIDRIFLQRLKNKTNYTYSSQEGR